jgi:hypothetical protein
MRTLLLRVAGAGLLIAGIVGAIAPAARGQITELPFDLVDVADDPLATDWCGVTFKYQELDPNITVEAGGAAWADFDNDGLLDLYLPNNKGTPSELYHNLGNGTFADEALARGVADPDSASACGMFFDYDHDGDVDLLVLSHLSYFASTAVLLGPKFKFFRNAGAGGDYTFADVTDTAGFVLGATSKLTKYGLLGGLGIGDYDQDGWSDFFATWYSGVSTHDQWRLMRNDPNPAPGDPLDPGYTPRIFTDATVGSGTEGEFGGYSHTPRWWDVNRDGWPDLHVAMDYSLDVLFINNHDGTFTNVATEVGLNGDPPEVRNEMGIALGDTDNDLDFDVHITNIGDLDRYYRNDSVKTSLDFTDSAVPCGLQNSTWGWGTAFLDLDNDGDLDHAGACGQGHQLSETFNTVHLNLFPAMLPGGEDVQWTDLMDLLTDFSKSNEPSGDAAHALAVADYDNDGDLDLALGRNQTKYSGVFRNTLASDNGWLEVDLVNSGGSLDTTGSRVYMKNGSLTQLRGVFTGGSTRSQDAHRLHFGLGPPQRAGTMLGGSSPIPATGAAAALGPAGVPSAGAGGESSPRFKGASESGPAWLVVRWPDGECQIVLEPQRNAINTIARSGVNDVGDLDADGHLTAADEALLVLAVQDPTSFALAYPASPGLIVGDVDDNGVLDVADISAWALLPAH